MKKSSGTSAAVALAIGLTATAGVARADDRFKGPEEDGTKPALTKIAGEGMVNSHAFEFLTELSDKVGARVTGTPQAQKAIDWGVAKMRSIGLENVHAEKWQLWRGWARGSAEAEILSPVRHKLHVDAMGWTGSTPSGGAEAELVAVNMFDLDQEIKNVSKLKGKIALVVAKGSPKKGFDMIFVDFGDFLRAASKAGAIAVIVGQGGTARPCTQLTPPGILG